ncbi:MAG: LysR family transcriptional regulator [Bdellovibrionales bacterium]|nr:LysR family transcriptional regulator [Bdellovibrionales bacterium]
MSFTETAKQFSVSQPSISRQIKLLEEQLNQKLFVRDKHKVHLTDAGLQLKSRLRPLIKEIKTILDTTQENVTHLSGTISFGCLTEVGQNTFIDMLIDFHKVYPNINFDTHFISPEDIIEKVKTGQLDFGVIGQAVELENIRTYELIEEKEVLVTRKGNSKPIEDIYKCEFITYLYHDVLLVSYLQKFYNKLSYSKIRKAFSVNSHKAMIEALESGNYYAVMPYFSVERAIKGGRLEIVSKNELKNHLYLIYVENNLMPMKNDLFKKHIISWCKKKSL